MSRRNKSRILKYALMTKFRKNGRLNFLYRNGNPGLKFALFCITPIYLILVINLDMHKIFMIINNNLTPYLNQKIE